MSDLTTLRAGVRYRLGNRTDLTTGDGLTALDRWINAAYQEICHTFRFTELESEDTSLTMSTSLAYVAVPSNVYAVLSVTDTTASQHLDPFEGDFAEYERRRITLTAANPTRYLIYANRIYFHPIPSAANVLRCGFWLEVTPLSAVTESPIIPSLWHDGIIILATRNGWRDLGDDTRAQLIETGEWLAFTARVRTPRAIEAMLAKRRGLRVRRFIRTRHKGV